MEKVIATHLMRADDGTEYGVEEIQEYIDASSHSGADWIEGLKRLELDDGSPVNFVDADTFLIVATGTTIRRVEPS